MKLAGKKKLIFDVTEDEFEEFVECAKEKGATRIGLFRNMLRTYQNAPFLTDVAKTPETKASKYRRLYLDLAFSTIRNVIPN